MKSKKTKGKSKDQTTDETLPSHGQGEILPPTPKVIQRPSNNDSKVALHAEMYGGPIPQAQELAKYEEVRPGAADRLITMAEKDQNAVIEWNRSALEGSKDSTKRGQWMGFFITIVAIITAAYIGLRGATEVGIAIALITGIGHLLRTNLKDLFGKNSNKS